MKWFQEESPSISLIEEPKTVLYVFAEWSRYAAHLGREIVEQAEQRWTNEHPDNVVSWRALDFTSSPSPLDPWVDWMKEQEKRESIRMFPMVGTGNGSVIWVLHGAVVAFALSAFHLGVNGVLERTKEVFGES